MTREQTIAKLKYFSPKTDKKIDWERVNLKAIVALDKARGDAGVPFKITSHYRSPEKDLALAGFVGAHADDDCTAFDIACGSNGKWDSRKAFKIVPALIKHGFNRIGLNNKNFHIHCDMSPNRAQDVLFIE